MRIFLAAELPEGLRAKVAVVQQTLAREGVRRIRWVDPSGIHLTLRFCGQLSRDSLDRLAAGLAPGPPFPRFAVRAGGLGRFPPRGAPRVLFLKVGPDARLESLASWLEDRVTASGIAPADRPYHAHLTLGRFLPGAASPPLFSTPVAEDVGELPVERVVVFQSHLGSGGARYEAMHAFPLRDP
ncbi:MAG TPA: RNA 2',3'-cyclic phosphodiesterase [Candidatus Polarisedimenticolia bacterium]|jgi:2'-5' RNA ligase|nr:RNA 2',3'-cyclic phosphodiesterase [Candidatus Polarisedimenticolia bacterium]